MTPPWIQLQSGAAYQIGSSFCLAGEIEFDRDVIIPLSRICRYLGHSVYPWSVAAHAVCASKLAERTGQSLEVQWYALHHDDHEALIGDMPAPLKRWLKQDPSAAALLESLERSADAALEPAKGSVRKPIAEERAIVRGLDLAMLMGEADALMERPLVDWGITVDIALRTLACDLVLSTVHTDSEWGRPAANRYRARHQELTSAIEARGWSVAV